MKQEQALKIFAKYLTRKCPTCNAAPGELCDSVAVWVHLERMNQQPAPKT